MTAPPTRAVKLFGTDEPPAETRLLTAGPLTAELDAGNLRYIRFQGREAIRAISYVVRDQYWGTFNPRIEDFEVEETAEGFTVSYLGTCEGEGQVFRYRAIITGASDGRLIFARVPTCGSALVVIRLTSLDVIFFVIRWIVPHFFGRVMCFVGTLIFAFRLFCLTLGPIFT